MVKVRENIPEMETFNREETAQVGFVFVGNLYGDGMVFNHYRFIQRSMEVTDGSATGLFIYAVQRPHILR